MCTLLFTYCKELYEIEVVPGIKLENEDVVHAGPPPAKGVDGKAVEPDGEDESSPHGPQGRFKVGVRIAPGRPLAERNADHHNTEDQESAEQPGKVGGPVGAAMLSTQRRHPQPVHGLAPVPVLQLDHALLRLLYHLGHLLGRPEVGTAHALHKLGLPARALRQLVVLLEDLTEPGVVELLKVLEEDEVEVCLTEGSFEDPSLFPSPPVRQHAHLHHLW